MATGHPLAVPGRDAVLPRIIFVANNLRVGGSQSVLLELVETAVSDGWEVVVATKGGPLGEVFAASGARCVELTMREGVAPAGRSAASPLEVAKSAASLIGARQLAALASDGTPTVLHASQPWPLAVSALASRLSHAPLIWHVHGVSRVEQPPPFARTVVRRLSAIVAVTPEVGEAISLLAGNTPLHVLPNPVATPAPRTVRRDVGVLEIGTCCTLTENKARGIEILIDATALLARERQVRLRIVGDGPSRVGLESYAKTHQAATGMRVEFLGEAHRPWGALEGCGAIAGVGLVAVEATLRGYPVVVAGSDGMGGLLTEDNARAMYATNYTGRGFGARCDAARLAEELRAALDQDPSGSPRLRDAVLARHGASARASFTALWSAMLEKATR